MISRDQKLTEPDSRALRWTALRPTGAKFSAVYSTGLYPLVPSSTVSEIVCTKPDVPGFVCINFHAVTFTCAGSNDSRDIFFSVISNTFVLDRTSSSCSCYHSNKLGSRVLRFYIFGGT
ncbi:hypothetical protein WN55_00118 [Dufourea novaeangliae]|uniref:Uncharacterized protein n=1 Tax=Dufourea novaeangliae TaxID=178035 RepID=A0A154NY40_DUFNO|nr:hypothetical protein WN55_00118 [Dufourea novaeangliae]